MVLEKVMCLAAFRHRNVEVMKRKKTPSSGRSAGLGVTGIGSILQIRDGPLPRGGSRHENVKLTC